jgi:predicted nucleotidyltransferase
VKQVFEAKSMNTNQASSNIRAKQGTMIVPVGIKQYGSQASFLAVDSSDVDLAVTGLKIGGDKTSQVREMRRLFVALTALKQDGQIRDI